MFRNPKYIYGEYDRNVPASLNLGDFILKKLSENAGKTALINGLTEEKLTYDEILQESINLAISLRRLGVYKGDVVAVSSENRREFWSSLFSIIYTGAAATTINVGYTKDELKHVLGIAKPKIIICSPAAYQAHSKIYKSQSHIKHVILYGDERYRSVCLYNDLATLKDDGRRGNMALVSNISYEEFMTENVEGQSDVAFILYSSGTTGLPKGVMLTHLNIIAVCSPTEETPTFLGLSITPWFHAMGLMGTLMRFVKGGTSVYLTKFEIDLYMSTIEKYKVVQAAVVPAMLVALSKCDRRYDTSSLQLMFSGAAPLYKETADAFKQRFPSVQSVIQAYGLTETTLAVTLNVDGERIGSVGCVTSNNIIKVVDIETREPLGPFKEGEICVKGVMVMKGYVGKDVKEDFDDEGFFKTGDIGYYDDQKYFYIVDRLKDLIKYKGYQVAPAEVEAVLLKHEGVKEAGVVGAPHPSAGEVPVAFVVPQPDATLTEKDIQEFVAERLSNPKHLRGGVQFIEAIPKNPTGKILRKELKKMLKLKKSKL